MDTQVGVAVRRWCAPLLGLPAHVPAAEYAARRLAMRNEDVARVLLPAARLAHLLVDTGYRGGELTSPEALGALAGAPARTILRLESLAEEVAVSGVSAAGFATAFGDALQARLGGIAGTKSVIAYRVGLDFDPGEPTAAAVEAAAGRWLSGIASGGRARLVDPVVLRFVLWQGVATGLPLQVHTGFGDTDLDLHRSDPSLLTSFLRVTAGRCPVVLLHTYPYQRQAGYLAQMFEHVAMDVGLAVSFTGARASHDIGESLELAPFTKVLFSSDGWGLPELHLLGSWLFRRGLARVMGAWVDSGDWSMADAERAVGLIASGNAERIYGPVG
jgi:hypothetical protein